MHSAPYSHNKDLICRFFSSFQTPFNVSATPFILNQVRSAYPNTSTPIREHAFWQTPHQMPSPNLSRMCASIPHITPIPHSGPPQGVDGRIWRSISARHVNPVYSYEDELHRIVRRLIDWLCLCVFQKTKHKWLLSHNIYIYSIQHTRSTRCHSQLDGIPAKWILHEFVDQWRCRTVPFRFSCVMEYGKFSYKVFYASYIL